MDQFVNRVDFRTEYFDHINDCLDYARKLQELHNNAVIGFWFNGFRFEIDMPFKNEDVIRAYDSNRFEIKHLTDQINELKMIKV